MPSLVHKDAREVPDGTRRIFHTPDPFVPDTLQTVLNGRIYTEGWTRLANTGVEFDEPPLLNDVISFFYQQA